MTNVETTTETTKRKVADHIYLDAAGNVVDQEEDAQGYRYKMLETDETFDWSWEEANELERKMLALFGAKTLATNVTSGARNNSKGAASAKDQMVAVKDRFSTIRDGNWTSPSEGGGGFAIDKAKLAQAIANVRSAMGKAADTVENYLRRFEEEAGYMAKCRKVPEVNAEYAKLAGRGVVSIDDI